MLLNTALHYTDTLHTLTLTSHCKGLLRKQCFIMWLETMSTEPWLCSIRALTVSCALIEQSLVLDQWSGALLQPNRVVTMHCAKRSALWGALWENPNGYCSESILMLGLNGTPNTTKQFELLDFYVPCHILWIYSISYALHYYCVL